MLRGIYMAFKSTSKNTMVAQWHKHERHQIKSNQITFIVTSPQHKCLGEWNSYERAPDSAEKQQTIYIWTDSPKKQQTITYGQTVQKTALEHLQCSRQCKKTTAIYIWTDSAKKNNNSNLHMDRQCKKNNNSNLHMDSTYLQTVQKTMCKIHIHALSTLSVL